MWQDGGRGRGRGRGGVVGNISLNKRGRFRDSLGTRGIWYLLKCLTDVKPLGLFGNIQASVDGSRRTGFSIAADAVIPHM